MIAIGDLVRDKDGNLGSVRRVLDDYETGGVKYEVEYCFKPTTIWLPADVTWEM